MGPSWYLMPEVFEQFFADLGARREDSWRLVKLPLYHQVFFGDGTRVRITDQLAETRETSGRLEPGGAAKLDVFTSLDRFVRKEFSDVRARQLLEYSRVFLGSSPSNAPALYSLMSHVDLDLAFTSPRAA
jgi:1-hydroxy-2-isopentenylcarotenoid 3,4-desaturase